MRETVRAKETHKKIPCKNPMIIQKRKSFDEWDQVYDDPEIVRIVFSSYNSLRTVFEGLRITKS